MAESVVSFAAKRLGDLLLQEAVLLGRVRGQVDQLQTELKLMQSFLKVADKRQDEDETVLAWVSEIREATYDAEDVIETFAFKIATRRRGGIQNAFKRYACIIGEAIELHKVGSEIEAIKTRISNLRTSLQTYGITPKSQGEGSSSAHGTRRKSRSSFSHVVEEYTVGLDEDVQILVERLVNEEKHCRVVSICGMGGLGKTTLAKKLYHHSNIRRHFDGFAWASISQQCQPKDVWEGILFKLISPSENERERIKRLKDDELGKELYEVQQEKKCLVILDDIWTTTAWDSLSPAFPIGKAGNKLLLTTRNKEVAQHVDDGRGFLHEPRCLTEVESWELLQKKAFPNKDDPGFTINTYMEELGRKMVGSCAGLPLAIVVLGGILATKHTLNEWNMVHENINSYLRRGKGHEQQHSGVSEVLALSYQELPYQLKPCFLHLAHFPEDFDIPTKKLFRKWAAEGIVSPMQYQVEGEETLEDVAERYLGELLDRCMVQVGVRGSNGRVKTCRMHDLMRDLCVLKANEDNFLKIVQDGNERMVAIAKSNRRVHRLVIYSSEVCYERTPYLRSLTRYDQIISQEMISKFSELKLLKILDLEKCYIKGEKLPRAIGNLIHLRYLSLNCDGITNIPSSIGNLRHLQTLILRNEYMRISGNLRHLQTLILRNEFTRIRVPNMIWKMEKLRHLCLPSFMKKRWSGKLRLGNLSDLQTLQGFDTSCFNVKELINLTNLKKLEILELESFKELEGILLSPRVTLNRLCSLRIRMSNYGVTIEETDLQGLLSGCQHLYKLFLNGRIRKLPEYPPFPPNLTKLSLVDSKLKEDPMATLEKLPNLSILHLYSNSFIGKEMVCSSKGFPQLKSLVLSRLSNWEEWHLGEEAMPSLRELVIRGCKKLKMVPDGLRFITTLQELQIMYMLVEFENRLRVVNGGGEDLYKVQHVPSIIFKNYV